MDNEQKEEPDEMNAEEHLTDNGEQCTDPLQTANESKTSQSNVSVRFENMLIDVVNATTLHLDWCPASDCDNIHGYKIRFSMRESPSYNEIFVTPGVSNYTISGLRPATEYIICVNAVDDKEAIIQHCGTGIQRTDAYDKGRRYDVPYITAIAGITLLLVAAIVPISFLFIRKCGICSNSSDTHNTGLAQHENNGAFTTNMKSNNSTDVLLMINQTDYNIGNSNNYKTHKP